MPKQTYLKTTLRDDGSNKDRRTRSALGRPILYGVLLVSSLANIYLFRAGFDKPQLVAQLDKLDLPSSISSFTSVASEWRQVQFDLLEGFLQWDNGDNNITATSNTTSIETRNISNLVQVPSPPTWLQSHLQWHLGHLTKTHATLKNKATRWAIDAEEVAHSMPLNIANLTWHANDQWDGLLAGGTSDTQSNRMAVKHHLIYSPNQNTDIHNTALWDPSFTSVLLPQWLQDYFAWHQEQRRTMTANNWHTSKFLIMYAPLGSKSGGMTDRVRPFAVMLRIAEETNRLLMIRWERPFALEEFLLPPAQGGCNWSVPDYMVAESSSSSSGSSTTLWPHPHTDLDRIYKASHDPNQQIVTTNYQSWNYGELFYNELKQKAEGKAAAGANSATGTQLPKDAAANSTANGSSNKEASLWHFYRDLWKVMFRPSPPVAQRIQQNVDSLQVVPGEFATVHIRALYGVHERSAPDILKIVTNAMNCVSQLRPGGPFFVASDSLLAIQMAMAYAEHHQVRLVTATHEREPLHIEFYNASDTSLRPSDFYDGFVDMYIMAATRCVAHGKGGFARWGQLLGYNSTCTKAHNGFKSQSCDWVNETTQDASITTKLPGYP